MSRGLLISRWSTIPSLPFNVGDLKKGHVVLEGNAFEVLERQIIFHDLPKFLYRLIQLSQFRDIPCSF
jgi:hypothetical protein